MAAQRCVRPARHARHVPQRGIQDTTTPWPSETSLTPRPAASTTPDASWPRTAGKPMPSPVRQTCRSLAQMPHAAMRTRTSPGPGSRTLISSMRSGSPRSNATAARARTPELMANSPFRRCGSMAPRQQAHADDLIERIQRLLERDPTGALEGGAHDPARRRTGLLHRDRLLERGTLLDAAKVGLEILQLVRHLAEPVRHEERVPEHDVGGREVPDQGTRGLRATSSTGATARLSSRCA